MSISRVQCDFFDTIGNCSLDGLSSPYYINVHVVNGRFAINSLRIQTKVVILETNERNEYLLVEKSVDYCLFLSKQLHNPILNVINRSLEGAVPTECPIAVVIY